MLNPRYVIFASYGNDSVALIQWAFENNVKNAVVVFSDTGWATSFWIERVEKAEAWVRSLGFTPARTTSMGMEALVRMKMGWPMQGSQFCTQHLKIIPALEWLELNDPDMRAICMVGIRREESENRKNFLESNAESIAHGGRHCWAPLVEMNEAKRNELILRAGFEPLPFRSMECFPCINANKQDLKLLNNDEERISLIEHIENTTLSAKGKPRHMFRPAKKMGATGIREIIRWANSGHGKFSLDDGTGKDCESGYCGI